MVLVGKPEVKRPLGRPKHRWEDNIMTDFQKVIWGVMDWVDLTQDRDKVVGTCKHVNEFSGTIKRGKFLEKLRNGWFLKRDSGSCSKKVKPSLTAGYKETECESKKSSGEEGKNCVVQQCTAVVYNVRGKMDE